MKTRANTAPRGAPARIKPLCVAVAVALLAAAAAQMQASATQEAILRASGDYPKAKTEQTVKSEKELAKLAESEKQLKASIKEAEISRSKLLAQKRADLKQIRKGRDDAIKAQIEEIKGRKTRQETLVRDLKKQLAAAKKTKNAIAITASELAVKLASSKLDSIAAEKKTADAKLSKSYQDYKATYDILTARDLALKKLLEQADAIKAKITGQKEEFKKLKDTYGKNIKAKEFLTAQGQMAGLVVLQRSINANYDLVMHFKKQFKSDYYAQIVNYKL
ncbi:MAG: hypothetical protein LBJ10_07085 [Clostridiales bacterium]|jgi:chromosome segregation ATPase|nr:hypothetical protein [Clostridiales bacterium]